MITSTDHFRPLGEVPFADLLDGRLAPLGIAELVRDGTSTTARRLTDGQASLWAYAAEDGSVDSFAARWTAFGLLARIGDALGVELVSDRDPRFWGFETQEEWDAAQARIAREHEEAFHQDVLAYAVGEPNGIVPGTIGERKAKIAVELLQVRPGLAAPERKAELLAAMDEIYDGRHAVRVTLDPREVELARAHLRVASRGSAGN